MNRSFNWWNEEPIQLLLLAAIVLLFIPLIIMTLLALITILSSHPLAVKWQWRIAQPTLGLVIIYHFISHTLNDFAWFGFWTRLLGWLALFVFITGIFIKRRNHSGLPRGFKKGPYRRHYSRVANEKLKGASLNLQKINSKELNLTDFPHPQEVLQN